MYADRVQVAVFSEGWRGHIPDRPQHLKGGHRGREVHNGDGKRGKKKRECSPPFLRTSKF